MPVVSVCIPAYRQIDYLAKCLQSVIDQDFTDYELIISDDTPGSQVRDFVHEFLKGRAFQYYQHAPSLGSPENWNFAVSKASGTYIKVLHHDDFFTRPDSLRQMVSAAEAHHSDFVFCATDVWFPATGFHRIHRLLPAQQNRMKQDIGYLFFRNCIGSPSATLYKRETGLAFDKNLIWLVDVDFYIRYLHQHRSFFYIDEPLISTAHETENQVTGLVNKDRAIQVREHVLLFQKLKSLGIAKGNFAAFFDYLFRDYKVQGYDELLKMVPQAASQAGFYKEVLSRLGSAVFFKRLKRKWYELSFNKTIFKTGQF